LSSSKTPICLRRSAGALQMHRENYGSMHNCSDCKPGAQELGVMLRKMLPATK